MAAIIRFFTKRFRKKHDVPAHSHAEEAFSPNPDNDVSGRKKQNKSDLECRVSYLDGTEETFFIPKNALASDLYELAYAYVGLNEEKSYFGLKYIDKVSVWLDPTKEFKKQCKIGPPYAVSLKVKFFASSPQNIRTEYARYLVVLQLRDDIQSGKLPCTDMNLAAELAALILQSEFGDYDAKQHTPVFVSTFRFLPEDKQTEEFELLVIDYYKTLSKRNLTPAAAEAIYLERAKMLPDYGVDMHTVKGKDGGVYMLGLTPTGILIYEGEKKIGLFIWSMIRQIEMDRHKLKILVTQEVEEKRQVTETAFCFILPDSRTCKHLWKCAVEHHTFFRLTDTAPVAAKRHQLFRLGSRFHASFNTEYQLHKVNSFGSSSFRKRKPSSKRSSPSPQTPASTDTPTLAARSNTVTGVSSFRRVPSRRFSARPSFAKRDQLDDQRARRDRLIEGRDPKPSIFQRAREMADTNLSEIGRQSSSRKKSDGPVLRTTHAVVNPSSVPEPSTNVTNYQTAVRITPLPSGKFVAPDKHPGKFASNAKQNGVRAQNSIQTTSEECFEYTV